MQHRFEHHYMKTDTLNTFVPVFIGGLLMTVAFPSPGLAPLAGIALVPLLFSLRHQPPRTAFRIGLVFGLTHYITLLYWLVPTIHTYGPLPITASISLLFLLAAYLALFVALFAVLQVILCRRPACLLFMTPVLWVSLEYIRTFLFTGFPWGLLGYTQYRLLPLIQIADVTGPYGVSFLIAFCNAALFTAGLYLSKKDWHGEGVSRRLCMTSIGLLIALSALTWTYGTWRIHTIDRMARQAPSKTFTVVQGNINQNEKWDDAFKKSTTRKYIDLSLATERKDADLVIWPETATPFYFSHDPPMTRMIQLAVKRSETHFLIGSPSFIRGTHGVKFRNSAYLITPEGSVEAKYDKAHLVPFGEYVPLKKFLPFLGKMVAQVGDFEPGPKGRTLAWQNHQLGVQICFEIIFPHLSRLLARQGASLLLNLTNDAWFGSSSGPYQHFAITVFRAVENKKALLRAANTGISGFIDPVGRIQSTTALNQATTQTHRLPLMSTSTAYTLMGDVFARLCLVAALFMGGMRFSIGSRTLKIKYKK